MLHCNVTVLNIFELCWSFLHVLELITLCVLCEGSLHIGLSTSMLIQIMTLRIGFLIAFLLHICFSLEIAATTFVYFRATLSITTSVQRPSPMTEMSYHIALCHPVPAPLLKTVVKYQNSGKQKMGSKKRGRNEEDLSMKKRKSLDRNFFLLLIDL